LHTYSGTYKTTILCAGVVKALAQNIGRSYSASEKAAKSRTCNGACIISIVAHGKNTGNACTVNIVNRICWKIRQPMENTGRLIVSQAY
jgi:hypothetical protein